MFGVVEEISLCGRKKKWGSIFGRLFTVGERGLEGGQAEDEEQGERERERAKVRSKVYKRAEDHGGSRPKCPFRVMEAEASAPEAREFLVLEGCSVVSR
jgi:hypothetical protein